MEAESQSSLSKNESENGKEEISMQKAGQMCVIDQEPLSNNQVSLQEASQMCVSDQKPASSNIVSLQEASQTCTGTQEQSCSDQLSLQEAIQPSTLIQKQLGTNKNPGNSRGNFYKLRQGGNNQSCHRGHNCDQSCGDNSVHVSNRGRGSNRGRNNGHGRNRGVTVAVVATKVQLVIPTKVVEAVLATEAGAGVAVVVEVTK